MCSSSVRGRLAGLLAESDIWREYLEWADVRVSGCAKMPNAAKRKHLKRTLNLLLKKCHHQPGRHP
jgi:hypothetical protein